MADGPFGAREIFIDLTSAGARVIRDAAGDGRAMQIKAIRINGTTGAGAGDIILRWDSASGPIVFKQLAPAGTPFDGTMVPVDRRGAGLYMDALAQPWAAGSFMIIYT